MQPIQRLRTVPIFQRLSDEHLNHLGAKLGERNYVRSAPIFHQGSEGDELHLIVSGQVRIYTHSESGQELSVRIFADGDFFGELALLDGRPRSATAEAMRPTKTLTLHRAAFLQAIATYPGIAITVLEELSQRLRATNSSIEHLAGHSAAQRIVRTLIDLADQHGVVESDATRINLHLTQNDLASLVGATRETVNRVLSGLREQGLVRIERAQLSVINRPALERTVLMPDA
jgi:CRP/FNR family transcriptional regulator, cyclic AMP receptor protein